MSALLRTVLHTIRQEYKQPAPVWATVACSSQNHDVLQRECTTPSEFDPLNTRHRLFIRMKQGHLRMEVRQCPYGQLTVIYDEGMTAEDIPWDLWGRILRLYTQPEKAPFQVFFLACDRPRLFPAHGPIQPLHINGGYTYPCSTDRVFVYRAEDATRVLIHELQHATCLDKKEHSVDQMEAETEAWAELLYGAFLTQGDPAAMGRWLQRQSRWIQSQNEKVKRTIGESHAFPWRYTVGKENVWRRWGILSPIRSPIVMDSLRLTVPPLLGEKKRMGVRRESCVL